MELSEEVLARAHAMMIGHVMNANPDRIVVFPTMKEEVRQSPDLTLDDFWPDFVSGTEQPWKRPASGR